MNFRANGLRVSRSDDYYLKTVIIIKTQKFKFANEHVRHWMKIRL